MLLVDCTASDEVADRYLPLLARGIGVVGANKRANSRCFASWQALQRTAREQRAPYRYETTAGAAIPLLGPLRDLRLRGERVHACAACCPARSATCCTACTKAAPSPPRWRKRARSATPSRIRSTTCAPPTCRASCWCSRANAASR
jgi:hypothetical protein